MRASMAIPGVFTPVRIDGMVLVDGGMKNNYPVNVAKAMGAEIIIGVDVQNKLRTEEELNTAPDILLQIIDLTTQENYARNVAASDVHIKVNVKGYSSASFTPNALDTLTNRGEEAALEKWDDLLKLKKKIGIPEDYKPEAHGPYTSLSSSRKFFVKEINFSGIEDADKKWMIRKCKLKEDSEISVAQLEKALSVLRGSQAYSNVSYKLTNMPEGYKLDFLLEEKYERNINLGIRFDSEETASVLLNATSNLKTRIPSKISITGRLGKRYAARVD